MPAHLAAPGDTAAQARSRARASVLSFQPVLDYPRRSKWTACRRPPPRRPRARRRAARCRRPPSRRCCSGRSWLRSIVVPLFLCFMSRLRNSCCRWRRRALRLKPVAHASNVMYCSSCRCILGLIRQKASPYNGTTAFMWFAVMLCPLVCAEYGTGLTGAPYATRCLGCFV